MSRPLTIPTARRGALGAALLTTLGAALLAAFGAAVVTVLTATTAAAGEDSSGSGAYSLNQGFVHFDAPPAWPVIMQKTEGNPQFIALQVKDPADSGTNEASRITVETKLLDDSSNFQPMVNLGWDKAKQLPGYEQRTDGVDPQTLRYFALNGKQRYEYRETWYLNGHVMVHARCQRPMLAATTPAWTAEYEKGCAQVLSSLRPH